jgi:hypothetical protein
MKPSEAVILDNWHPEENFVRLRRGHTSHATGMSGNVDTLMSWAGTDNTHKQFAGNGSSIFEVTSSGAVGAADLTGLSNVRFQHTMFNTSAGNYLYMVNGADAGRYYDGSSWATPTWTGDPGTNLNTMINIGAHKRRLFLIEENSLSFWYATAVSTITGGTISEFDLAPLFHKGGYLVTMGTWTRDGGAGMDDLAVFVTSQGEVAVFDGTDPGDAANWSLVGVFQVAPPIGAGSSVGYRSLLRVGADLIIVTEDGFAFLSKLMQTGRLTRLAYQSDRIQHALHDATKSWGSRFGWQPTFHPSGNFMLFNIPRSGVQGAVQYVANTTTGAWTRYTGWKAQCFNVCNSILYFGGTDGVVYKADFGLNDNGSDIPTDVLTAYNYFGQRGPQKKFNAVRPNLSTDGTITAAISVNVDFIEQDPDSNPTFVAPSGGVWDTALWDTAVWGGVLRVNNDWTAVGNIGYAGALRMQTASQDTELRWNATDWLYELGGFV